MGILAQNERRARGAYTGSLGYINERGDIDLNILIRTLVVRGSEIEFAWGRDRCRFRSETGVARNPGQGAGLVRALGIASRG